ncbi:E2 protein [Giraffa camelopardalis papillomavirus 1]|uniref:Regulatory protein E2 n=1 Tax=Giraffa camelopardalis papillomavirus 1 TaxID=1922325 RepID=A0A1L3GV75_9PAPI|nr:E2 protein [Giraffa camelopardalis papillomavirus 1]APG30982.1 E2 protein [Giraffa camelopardalis papillomavirus 1]
MKMAKAKALLDAAQEKQMMLIEKDSTALEDHVDYWSSVRAEMALLHAARRNGLQMLGCCPVPALQVTECKAKHAIEMQMVCEELRETIWGKDPWTAGDLSWERYCTAPAKTVKKGANVLEVVYDGNEDNANLYTVWSWVFMRSGGTWEAATGGADAYGIYYQTMSGARIYYETFAGDAARFGKRGFWEVRYQGHSYHSHPPSSRDELDGQYLADSDTGGHTADPAEPQPSRTETAAGGPVRGSGCGLRCVSRSHPYNLPRSSRDSPLVPASSPVQSTVPLDLAPSPETQASPPSPDSTQLEEPETETGAAPTVTFSLFKKGGHSCVLLQGSCNQAKCLRFRVKKRHRKLYSNVTTTWQTVGDEGAGRQGRACLLYTFDDAQQRECFLSTVSIPHGMEVQQLRVHLE